MSRFPSALATAAPSFPAVADGAPSIGAIETPALSRTVSNEAGGRSSANGCGRGWQAAAISAANNSAGRPLRRGTVIAARRWQAGRRNNRRRTAPDTAQAALFRQRDGGEAAPIIALSAQTGPPVAEEKILLCRRIVGGAVDGCKPK